MGVYRCDKGKPFILDCVRQAEKKILELDMDHEYAGIQGIDSFVAKSLTLAYGEENNQLKRSFQFNDFVEAFAFMTRVAFAAEKMNHHPNWSNVYNKVEIALFTHDAHDSITEKDRLLSAEIDKIYKK